MTAFAALYDEVMVQPWVCSVYEDSGYFNTGLWRDGIHSQRDACDALVREIVAPLRSPRSILDVACGLGATTRTLRRLFPDAFITAVNLSAAQLDICRRDVDGVAFECMDAASLAFAADSFDAIVCVEAAFHFATRDRFFAEAARVLRRGGRLVMSDMLFRDLSVVGEWMVPPSNRIGVDDYARRLAAAGFDDVVIRDETSTCWQAYCRNLGRHGALPDDALDRLERSVAHYVIVSATKASA